MVGLSRIMLKIVMLVISVADQDKHKLECIAIPFAMKYRLKRGKQIYESTKFDKVDKSTKFVSLFELKYNTLLI